MAEFKVGGKAVCIVSQPWKKVKSGNDAYGPKKDEVVNIVDQYTKDGILYLKLAEYPFDIYGSYAARRFVPLDDFQQVTYSKILTEVPVGAQ